MVDITKVKDIIEAFGLINDLATKIEALEASSASHTELESWKTKVFKLDEEITKLREKINGMSNGCSLAQQNLQELIELRERTDQQQIDIDGQKHQLNGIYKSVHGISPDQADKLKEEMNTLYDFVHQNVVIENNNYKEVLREFFKKMLHYSEIADFPSDQAHTNLRDFYKQQLEKLDGKTERKGCFNCGFLDDNHECENRDFETYKEFMYTTFKTGICDNYKEASGGDKVEEVRRTHPLGEPSPNSDISLQSKPPEPCFGCDYYNDHKSKCTATFYCEFKKQLEERLPGGTGKEPREDYNLPDLDKEGWILSPSFREYIKKAYIKLFPDEPPQWKDHKKYPRDIKDVLISEFLEKILAFNYALPAEPQIIAIREWLEEKLK